MSPFRRTQIRNYDVHDAGQDKVLPDPIENDEDPVELVNLISNLDRIRSMLRRMSGESYFHDDPISNIRELAGRSFSLPILDTWGIIARLQGMFIVPEGPVTDDGNGNISVPNILISNPLTKTYMRIQAFTAALGENAYVYFDLPPDSPINTTITATIVNDNPYNPLAVPPYDSYPSENRVVLAQRIGSGKVWFRFNWSVASFS